MNKKPHVIFDDVFFNINNTGIARVWRSILQELNDVPSIYTDYFQLSILNRSDALEDMNFNKFSFPQYDPLLPSADRRLLTALCEQESVDLFVSSYYTFPVGIPNLMPVYDLIPEQQHFEFESRVWIERVLGFSTAQKYFAISNSTKLDLIHHYPFVRGNDVKVSYPGIDHRVFNSEKSVGEKLFELPSEFKNYYVILGTRGGYKNFDIVLKTIAEGGFNDSAIVVVGGEALTDSEVDISKKYGVPLSRYVLNDHELAQCLRGAVALIYPSLYEGFGLPPAESLAVGTPVIVGNNSSLPEVVGDCGLYLSNNSSQGLIEAMDKAKSPGWRAHVKNNGPKQVSKFTWKKMACDFVDAVNESLGDQSSLNQVSVSQLMSKYDSIMSLIQA